MIYTEETEAQEDATLLLEHAIGKMSGREIRVCEEIRDGWAVEDDEDANEEHARCGGKGSPASDWAIFQQLKMQFIRELAEWKR